jgi:hypothetical protein
VASNQRIFESANAFRRSLETRLNSKASAEAIDVSRLRRQVAFERLLARLFSNKEPKWLLKGGYAIELYFGNLARATKDIDISVSSELLAQMIQDNIIVEVLELLRDSAEIDNGDWFDFRIGQPVQDLEGPPYGGARFPVEANLDNRLFTSFHLDVGLGDAVTGEPEWVDGNELLSFAGIPPARIALFPRAQQFAEKLHAYTYPREDRAPSRPKDLLDMVLLINAGLPADSSVLDAVKACFERRKTHEIPQMLLEPPQDWLGPFDRLVKEIKAPSLTMSGAFKALNLFCIEASIINER